MCGDEDCTFGMYSGRAKVPVARAVFLRRLVRELGPPKLPTFSLWGMTVYVRRVHLDQGRLKVRHSMYYYNGAQI